MIESIRPTCRQITANHNQGGQERIGPTLRGQEHAAHRGDQQQGNDSGFGQGDIVPQDSGGETNGGYQTAALQ